MELASEERMARAQTPRSLRSIPAAMIAFRTHLLTTEVDIWEYGGCIERKIYRLGLLPLAFPR